ncbi:serine hydrolase-like protein [Palaemon carinicauda]|uniref:serine hydrolase-like protein n=1 Tax=Palaemon carinicauda TaxID=392227 RepID=UPI0035B639BD
MPRQINWKEVNVDVGWGVLRGKRCFIGDSPDIPRLRVFGLHGWLDNANTFDRLVPLLPCGIEVFVLDFPGHGFSDHLPNGAYYSALSYIINVRVVVLELGWKSFVFMAHSLGSLIASYYTALFPEDVLALIQLDYIKPQDKRENIVTWLLEINLTLRTEQEKKNFPIYSREEALQRIIDSRKTGPKKDAPNIDLESAAVLLPRLTKQVDSGLTWIHDRKARASFEMLFGNDNWIGVLKGIKCPVLLIHALEGIYKGPCSEYEDIFDTYRANAKIFYYVSVEGPHHIHLSNPSRVSPFVNSFLADVMSMQNSVISKL